jgi:hypothetical protein
MTEPTENTEITEAETEAQATMHFELTMEEANLVLAALQELPHKMVNDLIQKIVQQGNSQLTD